VFLFFNYKVSIYIYLYTYISHTQTSPHLSQHTKNKFVNMNFESMLGGSSPVAQPPAARTAATDDTKTGLLRRSTKKNVEGDRLMREKLEAWRRKKQAKQQKDASHNRFGSGHDASSKPKFSDSLNMLKSCERGALNSLTSSAAGTAPHRRRSTSKSTKSAPAAAEQKQKPQQQQVQAAPVQKKPAIPAVAKLRSQAKKSAPLTPGAMRINKVRQRLEKIRSSGKKVPTKKRTFGSVLPSAPTPTSAHMQQLLQKRRKSTTMSAEFEDYMKQATALFKVNKFQQTDELLQQLLMGPFRHQAKQSAPFWVMRAQANEKMQRNSIVLQLFERAKENHAEPFDQVHLALQNFLMRFAGVSAGQVVTTNVAASHEAPVVATAIPQTPVSNILRSVFSLDAAVDDDEDNDVSPEATTTADNANLKRELDFGDAEEPASPSYDNAISSPLATSNRSCVTPVTKSLESRLRLREEASSPPMSTPPSCDAKHDEVSAAVSESDSPVCVTPSRAVPDAWKKLASALDAVKELQAQKQLEAEQQQDIDQGVQNTIEPICMDFGGDDYDYPVADDADNLAFPDTAHDAVSSTEKELEEALNAVVPQSIVQGDSEPCDEVHDDTEPEHVSSSSSSKSLKDKFLQRSRKYREQHRAEHLAGAQRMMTGVFVKSENMTGHKNSNAVSKEVVDLTADGVCSAEASVVVLDAVPARRRAMNEFGAACLVSPCRRSTRVNARAKLVDAQRHVQDMMYQEDYAYVPNPAINTVLVSHQMLQDNDTGSSSSSTASDNTKSSAASMSSDSVRHMFESLTLDRKQSKKATKNSRVGKSGKSTSLSVSAPPNDAVENVDANVPSDVRCSHCFTSRTTQWKQSQGAQWLCTGCHSFLSTGDGRSAPVRVATPMHSTCRSSVFAMPKPKAPVQRQLPQVPVFAAPAPKSPQAPSNKATAPVTPLRRSSRLAAKTPKQDSDE
jgi:hypothetical protein